MIIADIVQFIRFSLFAYKPIERVVKRTIEIELNGISIAETKGESWPVNAKPSPIIL